MAQILSAQRQIQDFRNITKMASLAIIAFTTTWLPYCVYVFICAFGGGNNIFDGEAGVIACLVANSSILYNPFVYALVNPRYSSHFSKKSFGKSVNQARFPKAQFLRRRTSASNLITLGFERCFP